MNYTSKKKDLASRKCGKNRQNSTGPVRMVQRKGKSQ